MLDILCVTKAEDFTRPFIEAMAQLPGWLVVCVDGEIPDWLQADRIEQVKSGGYFESVFEECIGYCAGKWVLRLDDDEKCTPAMVEWLKAEAYKTSEVWAFPRANLWGDDKHYLTNPPLFPDLQTRLTTRDKAGGRKQIHIGSPYGTGEIAPVMIEHHKFLVRSYRQRHDIASVYEAVKRGAGFSDTYRPYNLPESCFRKLELEEL